jgi:sugar/nucleoside kinase (ribokinase family)/kynurenine formamidase
VTGVTETGRAVAGRAVVGRPVRAVCIGVHIVDTLGRPVTAIPEKQGRQLLEEIRISPAGTAAGTAVTLAKLGADVVSMGAVGDDLLADFLGTAMRSHGVDVSGLARKPGTQTSATMLPIRPNGERPALHCPGATALLGEGDVDLGQVRAADVVHFGGPDVCGPFGLEPGRALLADAQAYGAITTVDVLSRGDGQSWAQLRALLAHTDYFLPNDDQLRLFTGTDDLVAGARLALDAGVRAVLVSCGPDGALLVTPDAAQRVAPVTDGFVDSTGCGDAVTAGFIAGLLRGWPPLDAAWLAMAAAGLVGAGLGSDAGDFDFAAAAVRAMTAAPAETSARIRADLEEQAPPESAAARAGRRSRPVPASGRGGPVAADLPRYADLPTAPGGGRSAWGLFGSEDSVGLFNLQTPDKVAVAARLVRTGEVFSLNAEVTAVDPPMFRRGAVAHTLIPIDAGAGYDDKLDNFYPQASSQWDSLAHVGYAPGRFYNGAANDDIDAGKRNTIDHWARRGIAGRAILLDIDALLGGAGTGFDPSRSRPVTVAELEAARRAAGVEFAGGDIVLLHTGYLRWYRAQDSEARARIAQPGAVASVGIERTEAMAEYLWDAHVVAVAGDNPAVEVWPPDSAGGPFGFLHRMLIGQFGLAIGELWWLDDLARSCRRDGRYEMFLTSAPLNVPGGAGSPANALAVK